MTADRPPVETDPATKNISHHSFPVVFAVNGFLDSGSRLAEQANATPILSTEDAEGTFQDESASSSLSESHLLSVAVHETLAMMPCTPEETLPSFHPRGDYQRPEGEYSLSDSDGSHHDEEEEVEYITSSLPEDLGNPILATEIKIDDSGKVTIREIFKSENAS